MREQIKHFREKHKLTQKEFAKLCGVGLSLIAEIERGETAEPKQIATRGKIKDVLAADSTSKGE